jgi:hypothetical protein
LSIKERKENVCMGEREKLQRPALEEGDVTYGWLRSHAILFWYCMGVILGVVKKTQTH